MKVFPVVFCCALALVTAQAAGAAGQGSGGSQVSPTPGMAASAVPPPQIQPHDKNGKPMTADEFNKAADARMQARMDASIKRLETRQAKWKKKGPQAADAPASK